MVRKYKIYSEEAIWKYIIHAGYILFLTISMRSETLQEYPIYVMH
jgi:hypothetical protein